MQHTAGASPAVVLMCKALVLVSGTRLCMKGARALRVALRRVTLAGGAGAGAVGSWVCARSLPHACSSLPVGPYPGE